MPHAVRMPKPGQMTEECVLTLWLKDEGDTVAKGDVLFEIETDKSTMEVESFHDGVVLRRLVAEGETVPVNAICAWVGAPGEAVPDVTEPDVAEPRTARARPRSTALRSRRGASSQSRPPPEPPRSPAAAVPATGSICGRRPRPRAPRHQPAREPARRRGRPRSPVRRGHGPRRTHRRARRGHGHRGPPAGCDDERRRRRGGPPPRSGR